MNSPSKSGPANPVPDFGLRNASDGDFDFARSLYMESMKPLLDALGALDSDKIEEAFRGYFIPQEVKIVQMSGADVGWLQVSRTSTELCIDQIHLLEKARGCGIGSRLIKSVIEQARDQKLDVSLSLVKGNPSRRLYERLGFRLFDEDDTKFHMRFLTRAASNPVQSDPP